MSFRGANQSFVWIAFRAISFQVRCGLIRAADKQRCMEACRVLPTEYGFPMSALPMLRIVLKHVRRSACLISTLEDPSSSLASPLHNIDGQNLPPRSFSHIISQRKYSLYSPLSFHFHGEDKVHSALCRMACSTVRT
jgi:hypothetical protein